MTAMMMTVMRLEMLVTLVTAMLKLSHAGDETSRLTESPHVHPVTDSSLVVVAIVLAGAGLVGTLAALAHLLGIPPLFTLRSTPAEQDELRAPALKLFDRIEEFQ